MHTSSFISQTNDFRNNTLQNIQLDELDNHPFSNADTRFNLGAFET